jgi:hypothetical protein
MCAEEKPSPASFLRNWRESDRPLWIKLGLLVRNNAKKTLTLSDCCGHYGEPGC